MPQSDLIQAQLGHHAETYLTDTSLLRLLALCPPQSGWRVLDVASGCGATTLAFAPRVRGIIATGPTPQMLAPLRSQAEAGGITNLSLVVADAVALPFTPQAFDLITCRLAAHHFPDVAAVVREMARVCKPGGLVAVTDHIVPVHGPTARYINAFEKLRDPAHMRTYALPDWESFFIAAGLEISHIEEIRKTLDFGEWVSRANVAPADRIRLEVMLRQAPAYARDALTPRDEGGRIRFNLTEAVIIGRRQDTDF